MSAADNFSNFLITLIVIVLIFAIIGAVIYLYFFSAMIRFIYSSTNNLFVTITMVAAIIFFLFAINETNRPKNYEDANKGFLENGGLYFIISGSLFIVSFIINLFTKKNQTNIGRINQRNINRINIRKNL